MKYLMLLAVTSLLMFSCSKDEDIKSDGSANDGKVYFELSAVNKLNDGLGTKAPVYSQEASQHVTRVTVYAFAMQGSDYVFTKSYDIPGWTDGTTFKRYAVADGDKVPQGNYKFLAVGRDATDMFTVTTPNATTKYEEMLASISASGNESEIFAGSTIATVLPQGSRVNIEMTRKVAGVLGYFKNVPQTLNGTTVNYLRLTVSNSNQMVNLTNGTGINTEALTYRIIDMDLSTQSVSNGVYTGNDLSGQGVVKVPNSQLGGSFFMPVSGVTMTLGLYDTNNVPVKEWVVKDAAGALSTFDILANNFYSLGMKAVAGSTTGDPQNPTDDDAPIDLLTDQNIVITITPAWLLIHNLVIQ